MSSTVFSQQAPVNTSPETRKILKWTAGRRQQLVDRLQQEEIYFKLGLPSLELQRLHLDLVYCYKIVFGLVKLNFSDYFDFSVAPTRGHLYKLYKYRCDSVRAGFFANRVVNVWNSLPEFVVFTSLSAFKRSIRTVDFNQFLRCNIN